MALTYCRECGAEVSSDAVVCPKCGVEHPARPALRERDREDVVVRDDAERTVVREPVVVERKRSGAGGAIALLLLLVLIALAAAWYFGYLHF